jgi:hypothetical protein
MGHRVAVWTAAALALALPAGATTYYVSASDPRASDSNPGTSASAPWRTVEHVASVAASLRAGDEVLLACGDVWLLTDVLYLTGMNTASAGAPLVFASYVLTPGVVERPHLARNTTANPIGPVVEVFNQQSIAFRGLQLSGAEHGFAFFYNVSGAVAEFSGVEVSDCHFQSLHGAHPNASNANWWGFDVAFGSAYAGVTVSDITIVNK